MENTQLTLDEILLQLQRQSILIQDLRKQIESKQNIPEFVTLQKACELKGMNPNSLYVQKWQQPCCGTRTEKLNGRNVWKRSDIIEWLQVTDKTLEEYAKKMGVNISKHFKDGKNK